MLTVLFVEMHVNAVFVHNSYLPFRFTVSLFQFLLHYFLLSVSVCVLVCVCVGVCACMHGCVCMCGCLF